MVDAEPWRLAVTGLWLRDLCLLVTQGAYGGARLGGCPGVLICRQAGCAGGVGS